MTDEQTVSPPAKRAGACRGHIALAVIGAALLTVAVLGFIVLSK
jgi:hypothetical protein